MKRLTAFVLVTALLAASTAALAEAFTPITVEGEDHDAYLNNLDICIESINDLELDTDETFSFNETVGERSEARGYQTAPNGRGVEVIGGGVAQVATTIYLAIKQLDDMEVTEKTTYGSDFCENYVAREQDALMTDYRQATDFRFVNRGTDVIISLWRDDDNVYCKLSQLQAEETKPPVQEEAQPAETPAPSDDGE